MKNKYRIPMFIDKKSFIEFQYVELGEAIECTLCGFNGEPQQCTGLKDKNNKFIYEGDILKAYYLNSDTNETAFDLMIAGFSKDKCAFGLLGVKTKYFELFADMEYIQEEYEIIGNIYENKNLLEK